MANQRKTRPTFPKEKEERETKLLGKTTEGQKPNSNSCRPWNARKEPKQQRHNKKEKGPMLVMMGEFRKPWKTEPKHQKECSCLH
jgi:hypothetical protein